MEWLVRLLNSCFFSSMVPTDWTVVFVVPLYEGKGDKYGFRGEEFLYE